MSKKQATVGVNDLESQFPKVAEYWDYEKNGGVKPSEVFAHSNKLAYWKCNKCGFSWKSKISNRVRLGKGGCPACSGKALLPGFNDLETTHPGIAKEWDYELNYPLTPKDIMHGSAKEDYWICLNGHGSYKKSPNKRTSQNSGCPECNRGRQSSFAEQALFYYVKKAYPDAINRYKEIFQNGMELDIYIPSISLAIEYDGVAFHKHNKLEREQRKYHICQQHKIKLLRIKEEEIKGMWLSETDNCDELFQTSYDGKDFEKLEDTIRRIIFRICFYYKVDVNLKRDENEIRSLNPKYFSDHSFATLYPEIAKEWHPTKNGTQKPNMYTYGSTYNAWWLCPKCGHEWQAEINKRVLQKTGCKKCYLERIKENCPNNVVIYQYSLDGEFIKEWKSISEASRCLKINAPNISMCAKGKRPNAGGYKWSYKKT